MRYMAGRDGIELLFYLETHRYGQLRSKLYHSFGWVDTPMGDLFWRNISDRCSICNIGHTTFNEYEYESTKAAIIEVMETLGGGWYDEDINDDF